MCVFVSRKACFPRIESGVSNRFDPAPIQCCANVADVGTALNGRLIYNLTWLESPQLQKLRHAIRLVTLLTKTRERTIDCVMLGAVDRGADRAKQCGQFSPESRGPVPLWAIIDRKALQEDGWFLGDKRVVSSQRHAGLPGEKRKLKSCKFINVTTRKKYPIVS